MTTVHLSTGKTNLHMICVEANLETFLCIKAGREHSDCGAHMNTHMLGNVSVMLASVPPSVPVCSAAFVKQPSVAVYEQWLCFWVGCL